MILALLGLLGLQMFKLAGGILLVNCNQSMCHLGILTCFIGGETLLKQLAL